MTGFTQHSDDQLYMRHGDRMFTYAEHCAWLESLSPDDREILYAPIGWRYTFVLAAEVKRWLLSELPPDKQFYFVDNLDRMMPGGGITKAAIAAVEPACDTAARMFSEAFRGSPPSPGTPRTSFLDIIADFDVFKEFVRLNPSLRTALRLCSGRDT